MKPFRGVAFSVALAAFFQNAHKVVLQRGDDFSRLFLPLFFVFFGGGSTGRPLLPVDGALEAQLLPAFRHDNADVVLARPVDDQPLFL